ncbi:rnhA operon protein [Halobellus sp. MBLA0160]|uniref:RnhA operon protein n=1 Tax=Halobellus ruber TaxID=2761102 RepID=A0A7J9SML3_9EURY|nr:rnhA operon protein [Halobellus ruber]
MPEEVVSEAERLTRLATDAAVDAEAAVYRDRRAEIVREHDFVPRVREEDDTLVLYPEEWVEEGLIQLDRIEDTDRAVEVSLSGPDHGAEWEAVEADNEAIVAAVAEEHGQVHAANVRAFADFMGNHYLKRVDDATEAERAEFLTEYYPRNAWPSAEQAAVVEESLRLAAERGDGT